jgi:hypothetical protein
MLLSLVRAPMRIANWRLRIAVVTAIVFFVGITRLYYVAPRTFEGHRSSLYLRVTAVDGTQRTITLEGVGCKESMCSRVVVGCVKTEGPWLDSLTSIRNIIPNHDGSVNVTFRFRNGGESKASVVSNNRVLYVDGLWRTKKLDLGGLTEVDFLDR